MIGSAPVAILGLGLVAVNTATAGYGGDIKAAVTGEKSNTGGDPHKSFLAVGGQIAFVVVLALLADASPDFATIAVALLIGLWLVWAVTHADKITAASKALGVFGGQ